MKALTSSLILLTLSVAAVANLFGAEAAYAVLAAAGVLAIAISDYSDRPVPNCVPATKAPVNLPRPRICGAAFFIRCARGLRGKPTPFGAIDPLARRVGGKRIAPLSDASFVTRQPHTPVTPHTRSESCLLYLHPPSYLRRSSASCC